MVAHLCWQRNNVELESKDKLKYTLVSPDTPKHGVRAPVKVLNFQTASTAVQTELSDPRRRSSLPLVEWRAEDFITAVWLHHRTPSDQSRALTVFCSVWESKTQRAERSLWVSVPPSRTRQSRHAETLLFKRCLRPSAPSCLAVRDKPSLLLLADIHLETWPNHW